MVCESFRWIFRMTWFRIRIGYVAHQWYSLFSRIPKSSDQYVCSFFTSTFVEITLGSFRLLLACYCWNDCFGCKVTYLISYFIVAPNDKAAFLALQSMSNQKCLTATSQRVGRSHDNLAYRMWRESRNSWFATVWWSAYRMWRESRNSLFATVWWSESAFLFSYVLHVTWPRRMNLKLSRFFVLISFPASVWVAKWHKNKIIIKF